MKNKYIYIIFFILILVGIFLRFYNLRFGTQFDWDQENGLAYPAKDIIVNKHYPLIGGKTGIADLYYGPLFYYLSSLSSWLFQMDPISGAIQAGVLSTITIIIGFILIKKAFNVKTALFYTTIWTTSPYLLSLDRIPWNVNLFPLAATLIYYGLIVLLKEIDNKGWIFVGLGILIGVSSHITVIYFILLSVMMPVFLSRLRNKWIFSGIFISFFGFFPLILFELRHNFYQMQNAISFFSQSVYSGNNTFDGIVKIPGIILQIVGKILLLEDNLFLNSLIGIIFLYIFYVISKTKSVTVFIRIALYVSIIYIVGFTIYSKPTPEYYYIGLFPIITLGFALICNKFEKLIPNFNIIFIIFCLFSLSRSYSAVNQINNHGLGIKQKITKEIKTSSNNSSIYINYDMKPDWTTGYGYLLDYYGVKTTDNNNLGNVYWITYPKNNFPGKPDFISGDIALGFPDNSKRIYSSKTVNMFNNLLSIRIPKEWVVLECPSIDYDKYIFSSNMTTNCINDSRMGNELVIMSLPECNIFAMNNFTAAGISSGISLYEADSAYINNIVGINSYLVTSFERNRCVVFSSTSKQNFFRPDKEIKLIIESIRKN